MNDSPEGKPSREPHHYSFQNAISRLSEKVDEFCALIDEIKGTTPPGQLKPPADCARLSLSETLASSSEMVNKIRSRIDGVLMELRGLLF